MIGVFTKVSVKHDSINEFEAFAQQLTQETPSQYSGCASFNYGPLVEEGAEGEYGFIERWESQQAYDSYRESDHFKEVVATCEKFLNEPLEMRTYEF